MVVLQELEGLRFFHLSKLRPLARQFPGSVRLLRAPDTQVGSSQVCSQAISRPSTLIFLTLRGSMPPRPPADGGPNIPIPPAVICDMIAAAYAPSTLQGLSGSIGLPMASRGGPAGAGSIWIVLGSIGPLAARAASIFSGHRRPVGDQSCIIKLWRAAEGRLQTSPGICWQRAECGTTWRSSAIGLQIGALACLVFLIALYTRPGRLRA